MVYLVSEFPDNEIVIFGLDLPVIKKISASTINWISVFSLYVPDAVLGTSRTENVVELFTFSEAYAGIVVEKMVINKKIIESIFFFVIKSTYPFCEVNQFTNSVAIKISPIGVFTNRIANNMHEKQKKRQ